MSVALKSQQRIIVALDVDTPDQAFRLYDLLKDHVGVFKIGLELTTSAGIQVVQELKARGAEKIFLDLKLHDVPNTVAGAMRAVARLGVWCVTVHTQGGAVMLRSAVEAAKAEAALAGIVAPNAFGVTLLTSIGEESLHSELQVPLSPLGYVSHLASLAYSAGCAGVIASPLEIEAIRNSIPSKDFLIVTPGVRPAGSAANDQARVMTPGQAVQLGADYLVIGRPITQSADPVGAAEAIAQEIASALSSRP